MTYKYPLCVHDHICELTAGICPIVGCPKELVNGPCGGVKEGGKCEVIDDLDCVWVKIYDAHKAAGTLPTMLEIKAPRNTNFYSSLVSAKGGGREGGGKPPKT